MRYIIETPHFHLSYWHMVCRVGLDALLLEVRSGWVTYDWTPQSHSFDFIFCPKLTIIGYSIRIGLVLFWCILCVIIVVQCDVTIQTLSVLRSDLFCVHKGVVTLFWTPWSDSIPWGSIPSHRPFPQNVVQHEFEQEQHEPTKRGR